MARERIALFKVNYLGDAVTFLPTVAALRRLRPDADLVVVCSSATASLYQATFPAIEIIKVDRTRVNGWRGVTQLPGLAAGLGIRRLDAALLSHDEPGLSHVTSVIGRAPRRIGFSATARAFQPLLSELLPAVEGRNVVDLNFDLVRALTGDWSLQPERVAIGYRPEDDQAVTAKLAAAGIAAGQDFVLLHPFAKRLYQQWGVINYQRLAALLASDGVPSLLLMEQDDPMIGSTSKIFGLSLHQLVALCARARLFIGSNSGPMHIAAAMGTATLAIQGPTAIGWNVGWTDRPHRRLTAQSVACSPCEKLASFVGHCTNDASPLACMTGLSPSEVHQAAMEAWKG